MILNVRATNHASLVSDQSSLVRVMKRLVAIGYSYFALTACSSVSQPPLDQSAALAVARQAIARRERWLEGVHVRPNITQSVCYQTTQSTDGSWTITAHKCIAENDSGNTAYEPNTKRVIVISDTGKVIQYSRAQD